MSLHIGICQNSQDGSFIPPSPQSAQLFKVSQNKVSLNTGTSQVSIPLYTIHAKGIDIPVELSYFASGIQYKQPNGDVGVGWVLTPGFRISRTVCGMPDDRSKLASQSIIDSIDALNQGFDKDKELTRFIDPTLPNFNTSIPQPYDNNSYIDGEYDLFNFTTPNESGNFLITDRVNNKIEFLDCFNNKLKVSKGNSLLENQINGYRNFKLIDGNGNSFYYGERDTLDKNVYEVSSSNTTLPTSWALTEIATIFGDKIKFHYSKKITPGWHSQISTTNIYDAPVFYPGQTVGPSASNDFNVDGSSGYISFLIERIEIPNGQIQYYRNEDGTVNKINVVNNKKIVKEIEFFYSVNSGPYIFHKFLDSIQVKGNNDNINQTYKFNYLGKNAGPKNENTWKDQWGYYMNATPLSYHSDFKNDLGRLVVNGPVAAGNIMLNFGGPFADRSSGHNSNSQLFSLSSIIYPTGGKTEYSYEPNEYYNNGSASIIKGGGIRIRQIVNYDSINRKTFVKLYSYDGGYPKMNVDKRFFQNEIIHISKSTLGNGQLAHGFAREITYSTELMGDVAYCGFLNGFVSYQKVTEILQDYKNDKAMKMVYYYSRNQEYEPGVLNNPDVTEDLFLQYNGAPYITGYRFWDKPELIKEETFNDNGDLVKRTNFKYSTKVNELTGIKVKVFGYADDYNDYQYMHDYYYINPFSSYFRYSLYKISYGVPLIIEQNDIIYTNNDSLMKTNSYEYNNYGQVIKNVSNNGDLTSRIKFYIHPLDYGALSGFIDSMKYLNVVNPIIEQNVLQKNSNGSFSILSGSLSKYNPDKPFLVSEKYSLESGLFRPINLDDFKFSNSSIGQLPFVNPVSHFAVDSKYKLKVVYSLYDSFNNVRELRNSNGLISTYLWGYNGTYPVAMIIGSDYGIVKNIINQNILDNKNGQYDNAIENEINKLRSSPNLFNAEVYTYLYEPLIGMISESRPNGVQYNYFYDSIGNLSFVKDKEGRVLEKNEYHLNPTWKYYNEEQRWLFTRNNCNSGYLGDNVEFTVPAGKYTSIFNQTDANQKAKNELDSMGQQFANTNGGCHLVYYNTQVSKAFVRNNCLPGFNGGTYTVTIPAKKFSSILSQEDANKLANDYFNELGQIITNSSGSCNKIAGYFYNIETRRDFKRLNCGNDYIGGTFTYIVPKEKYYSSVSQAAANQMAVNEIDINGQNLANSQGPCTLKKYVNFYTVNLNAITGYNVKLTSVNDPNRVYSFNIGYGGPALKGQVLEDEYNISVFGGDGELHDFSLQCAGDILQEEEASWTANIMENCSTITIR